VGRILVILPGKNQLVYTYIYKLLPKNDVVELKPKKKQQSREIEKAREISARLVAGNGLEI
jgi:hypothetical protein